MSRTLRASLAALIAALGVGLGAPAGAMALGVQAFSAKPDSTQAGGHSNFRVSITFDNGSDQVRNLVLHLPAGLVGNPATPQRCTEQQFQSDSCPAASVTGDTTVHATVSGLIPVDATGHLYNLVPHTGELARLGISTTATVLGMTSTIRLESPVSIRSNGDFGLDSTITDIPNSANGMSLRINGMDMTINGQAGSPAKPFLTNPTSCAVATTRIDVTPWSGAPGSGSATFTPTGCGALPYRPALTASVAQTGDGARHVQFTTNVTQGAGQANSRRVVLSLPASLGPDLQALSRACTTTAPDASTCPTTSIIGNAVATTPLLPSTLSGPVYLVTAAGSVYPNLVVRLSGPISITLRATQALVHGRLAATLDGLPDVPLTGFKLTINGGRNGLLVASRDLCRPPTDTAIAAFTAQSGTQATATAPLRVTTRCAKRPTALPRPAATAGLRRGRNPLLTLRVVASGRAPAVRGVSFRLPRGVALVRRPARGSISVSGSRRHLSIVRGRTQLVVHGLPRAGVRVVTVTLRRGALRLGGRVGATMPVVATDTRNRATRLTVRLGRLR